MGWKKQSEANRLGYKLSWNELDGCMMGGCENDIVKKKTTWITASLIDIEKFLNIENSIDDIEWIGAG